MPKIESIRPGDTLDATFNIYPLADLLIGILRGNLTGRLDVFLHPEPRNVVHFQNGVPVVVQLPDGAGSLIQLLVKEGRIAQQLGLELLRAAESGGRASVEVIEERRLLSPVELHQAEVRRARQQLVGLFDAGPVEFQFHEGARVDARGALTILQPLPIVYEGLLRARDQTVVARFLEQHANSKFTLSATYPKDVDPFEWGSRIEAAVVRLANPAGLTDILATGLDHQQASVALAALHLADMLDLREQGATQRAAPIAIVAGKPVDPPPDESQGLVVHRRSAAVSDSDAAGRGVREVSVGGNAHDREYVAVRDRMTPYFGQTYFQILRVTADTDAAQLDRAYRFLIRRFEEEMDRPGTAAVLDLIHEAYEVLREPDSAQRYGQMVERGEKLAPVDRERRAFEAEPKVDRALRAMGAGRTGEATLLLSWAERLDPSRTDLSALFGVLDVIRAPDGQRAADARAMRGVLQAQVTQRSYDWRIKLCLALILAEDGEPWGATRLLENAPDPSHPMAQRISTLLGGS